MKKVMLVMVEKTKASQDTQQFRAAIMTDLSKAFDCICYSLLIAKLSVYGFDKKAIKTYFWLP